MKRTGTVLAIVFFMAGITNIHAQAPDSSRRYHVFLEPYLLAPSMSGTSGIGRLPEAFVCIPAADLLKHLQIGGMLFAEVHNNRFAFSTDLFYADLSSAVSGKNGIIGGTADLKQFWWEADGLYKLSPWLEAGAGLQYNSIKAALTLSSITPGGIISQSGTQSNGWVDPLLVARVHKWINPRWMLSMKADIGGFGMGSQFTWQLQPTVGYRASRLLQIGLGYRVISIDYNNGKSGSDRLVYDMEEYGPQLRIGFHLN